MRRLQSRDKSGRWHPEAYAIEMPDGQIEFRYPLSWEFLGARYHGQMRDKHLPLERVNEVLSGRKLCWLAVETLQMDYDEAMEMLDRECHILRLKKRAMAKAA